MHDTRALALAIATPAPANYSIRGRVRVGTHAAPRVCIMAKAPYAIAWLLGIPIPILLLVFLFSRAC